MLLTLSLLTPSLLRQARRTWIVCRICADGRHRDGGGLPKGWLSIRDRSRIVAIARLLLPSVKIGRIHQPLPGCRQCGGAGITVPPESVARHRRNRFGVRRHPCLTASRIIDSTVRMTDDVDRCHATENSGNTFLFGIPPKPSEMTSG